MKSKAKKKIKVVIAEDHPLMRKAYIDLIADYDDISVVAEAENGKELLTKLKDVETDIVLLDLSMPVMTGGEAYPTIKKKYPHIKVIIISTYFDDNYVTEYFMKGVKGYLSKGSGGEDIVNAIHAVMNGDYFLTEAVSKSFLNRMLKEKEQQLLLETIKLTDVEKQILRLVCEEKSSNDIANELAISRYSVDHYRRSIINKTQQSSAIGLFKFAVKNGIAEI